MEWSADRWRLYGLAAREAARVVRRWVANRRRPRLGGALPKRLLIAPQDIRTADPTIANDVYGGVYVFAGRVLNTGGRSPFTLDPPSEAWGEALYGFGWLRHLRAADNALARANARALVDEYLERKPSHRPIARRTHVVARRVVSLLAQSPLILEGADFEFYRRFMRGLARDVADLHAVARRHPQPYRRLQAVVALCYAGLCFEGAGPLLKRATRWLGRELGKQVHPDGGHASRNPAVMIELLLDLLPLRQTYVARGLEVPESLIRAIDRMLPMLRTFRHGDGSLAHVNGMGRTPVDHLATILFYDETRAGPLARARQSGYERLEAGDLLLVADVGGPPRLRYSWQAHAGCLAFELSSGRYRIVVNCGAPTAATDEVLQLARTTAAHSTAVVADTSSARFLTKRGWGLRRRLAAWLTRRLGPVILQGPEAVVIERTGALELTARHDGYARRFGITHERRWRVRADGERLDGEDALLREGARGGGESVAIRFHLDPDVRASQAQNGRIVMLVLPNRETWQFAVEGAEARLDESVFFAAVRGPRRTQQIVLQGKAAEMERVHWRFERLTRAPSPPAPVLPGTP